MKIIKQLLAVILGLFIPITMAFFLKDLNINIIYPIFTISSILFTLSFIVGYILFIKKMKGKNQTEELTKMLNINDDIDLNKIAKKHYRYQKLNFLYYIIVLMITIILSISSAALITKNDSIAIPYFIFSSLTLIGFIYSLIRTKVYPNQGFVLERDEFKHLYQLIDEIQNELEINEEIIIQIVQHNFVIFEYFKKKYYLSINIMSLLMFSEEELKAYLYNLISITKTNELKKDSQYTYYIQPEKLNSENYLLIFPMILLAGINISFREKQLFNLTFLLKNQDEKKLQFTPPTLAQAYINALVKEKYWHLFIDEIGHDYQVLKNEYPSLTYYEDLYEEFITKLNKKIALYDDIISYELDPIYNPTVLIRHKMEKLNISSYNIDFSLSRYNEYELRKILNIIQEVTEQEEQVYTEIRNINYIPLINIINKYEENPSDILKDLVDYAFALLKTNQIRKSFEVFKYILVKYPDSAQANYGVGFIYLEYFYDKKGIDYLYKAALLNENYVEQLDSVGRFTIKMGLKEEHDKFKSELINKITKKNKIDQQTLSINVNTKLTNSTLSNEVTNDIVEQAKKLNFINELFIVKKELSQNEDIHFICVTFSTDDQTKINNGMNELANILDLKNDRFGLFYINNTTLYKKLNKITKPYQLAKKVENE